MSPFDSLTGSGGTGTYRVSSSQLVYSSSPGTAESMNGEVCGQPSINTPVLGAHGDMITLQQIPGLSHSCRPSNNRICDGTVVTGANSLVNPTLGSLLDARLGSSSSYNNGSTLYGAGSSGGSGGM